MTHEQSKAGRYVQLLDQARCGGDWEAVPELVRKVRKHAPERSCLALAAECEHAVTQATKIRNSNSMTLNTSGLGHLAVPLSDAIEKEKSFAEDEFQARVCLGWIYWAGAEPLLACQHLPISIEQDFAQLDGANQETASWTKVCALKACYIKGTSLVRTGSPAKALETFESALPMLPPIAPKVVDTSLEHRTWTELLLTEFCMLSSSIIKIKVSSTLESEALSAFRAWASFWDRQPGQAGSSCGGFADYSDVCRRQIWKEYYNTLSNILQQGLPFPTTVMATAYTDPATRLLQQAELQRVEIHYENLLLKEVQFPRADEASEEVEEWADTVVHNWRVLCGSNWQEQERDQSKKEVVSRRVLDILYRAATKTFHSTSILRHLFTVHLAVGELSLAFKAFDTYLEIVKKGKARVEKTGEAEKGLDDDEVILVTASDCIRALCRYGSRRAAEKAKDLARYFEDWLQKHQPQIMTNDGTNEAGIKNPVQNGKPSRTTFQIAPESMALAWRSIGIGYGQWARLTYDAGSRSGIQEQAIKALRKALSPTFRGTDNVETLFALALIFAERRELDSAIEVVKSALLPPKSPSAGQSHNLGLTVGRFARERSLIPLWHLLALLLSARQEFTTAARACEGAFEQFQDPKNLFGNAQLNGSYRSEHLNMQEISEKPPSYSKGLVDDMDDFQKQAVLEVKMTQLILIEVLEGPDVAVNASDELLSLFTRLFGEPQKSVTVSPKTPQTLPPQSSAGTLRSIKGSIFGRSRRSIRKSAEIRGRTSPISENSALPLRPQTSQPHHGTIKRGPAIHVTNENGGTSTQPPHHEKLQKRSASLSRKKSQGSMRNRSSSAGRMRTGNRTVSAAETAGEEITRLQGSTNQADRENSEKLLTADRLDQVGRDVSSSNSTATSTTQGALAQSSSKPLPPTSQNIPQKGESLKRDPVAQQDTHLPQPKLQHPFSNPVTRFPKDQERRRRTEILIKVWLLIAGFYRRAEMIEDAKGAIDEAYKLVEGQEMDISRDTTGSVSIDDGGWGSTKSVEELWGDVWSERGYLSVAREIPYTALSEFEAALTHHPDHPSAIVGLSNILLDIYCEVLLPPPTIPSISTPSSIPNPSQSTINTSTPPETVTSSLQTTSKSPSRAGLLPHGPLGLPNQLQTPSPKNPPKSDTTHYTALLDRLAARDRAYGLLSGLTKLGTGWNYSEAWFALARAQEEAGLVDKARDALWWCVELEEGKAVRNWDCVGAGGYVL